MSLKFRRAEVNACQIAHVCSVARANNVWHHGQAIPNHSRCHITEGPLLPVLRSFSNSAGTATQGLHAHESDAAQSRQNGRTGSTLRAFARCGPTRAPCFPSSGHPPTPGTVARCPWSSLSPNAAQLGSSPHAARGTSGTRVPFFFAWGRSRTSAAQPEPVRSSVPHRTFQGFDFDLETGTWRQRAEEACWSGGC